MENNSKGFKKYLPGILCLAIVIGIFGGIGSVMGVPNMLNTIMKTAHDLLLNTVFYLMAICVITGALGSIFVEFGVVNLLERILRPLMKPLFNLPGVASLGAVMTFLSDNPAIISLAKDKRFSSYFKKFQFISLTNFGTAFGMGLLVIVFMISQGYFVEPFIGLIGAFIGCIVSTRLMQRFILKQYPNFAEEFAAVLSEEEIKEKEEVKETSMFTRILNSLLDGGKTGVDVGISIIPGVLIISTLVMLLTFGTGDNSVYDGAAYEGVEFLPWLFGKINFVFDWLFGFENPALMAFPITSLGAVGAALSLVPTFVEQQIVNGNAIAVFTAIGMCWSGYLSTHTAMLDALGYRKLTSKAILAHTIGGIVAAISAHWLFVLYTVLFGVPTTFDGGAEHYNTSPVVIEIVGENQVKIGDRIFTDEADDTPEEEGSLARYISAQLLEEHSQKSVDDGEKIDVASIINGDKLSAETQQSLIEEIEAGFYMYRDTIAVREYNRPFAELTEEEAEAITKAIPFQIIKQEEVETSEKKSVEEEATEEGAEITTEVETATPAEVAEDPIVAPAASTKTSIEEDIVAPMPTETVILFGIGEVALTNRAKSTLNDIAIELSETNSKVYIAGFADKESGSSKRNGQLSMQRAQSVANYFVNAGIDASRITTEWFGDSKEAFVSSETPVVNRCVIVRL